jgi:hypothetical protein
MRGTPASRASLRRTISVVAIAMGNPEGSILASEVAPDLGGDTGARVAARPGTGRGVVSGGAWSCSEEEPQTKP